MTRTTTATIPDLVQVARRAVLDANEQVRRIAAAQVADTFGCLVAGSTHPTIDRLATYVESSAGSAAGWSFARPDLAVDVATSIALDATASHVDEFDSVHPRSGTVPSGIVVPTALALGRRLHASGEQVLGAVIAGYEVMIEASIRRGGSQLYRRSWWPSLVFGPLGAAAATAHLLGLDDERFAQALALAAGSSGGLLTADVFGDGHYWHFGEAAARGARSGLAAEAGMTASLTLLDRPSELAFGPPAEPSGTDREPHVAACVYKAYPCAMPLQPVASALADLRQATGAAAIRDVHIGIPEVLLTFVTSDVEVAGPAEAAASASYVVAAGLAGDAADLSVYRRYDPAEAGRIPVAIVADDRAESPTGVLTAIVRVVTTDGATQEIVQAFQPSGGPDPDKFARNLTFGQRSGATMHTWLDLAAVDDVTTLVPPVQDP